MPFLGLTPRIGKNSRLTKPSPIYFAVYPSVAPLGSPGTALSSASLTSGVVRDRSTGATVAGTFSFVAALSTIPLASQKSIAIKFTPTTALPPAYPATITVYVGFSVNRTTPTISVYPFLSSLMYGSPKSAVLFSGGVASCPGTFSFANTQNRVLDPGVYVALECVFTPTDTLNFKSVEYISPNNLNVNKRQTVLMQYPTVSGGGFMQPLSNFTINSPSNTGVFADGPSGLTLVASVTKYSFISSPSTVVTGTTNEGITCSISTAASVYYLPPLTFFVSMPVLAPAPVMAGWDIKTSQLSFPMNDTMSRNQVSTKGATPTSVVVVNANPNSAGSASSSGYRWYGKSGILTLADAQTNNSYISLVVNASSNFNKVITGMTPTLFGRSTGAPNQLALLYSEDPTFASPGRTISFDVIVPSSGNTDLSADLAGSLASNPVTILAGRTGYFRIYYYGQTSTTAFLMLLGNTSLDIGFIGYEVQQLPDLLVTGRCSWFRPGLNSSTFISGTPIQYWVSDSSVLSPISISGLGAPSTSSARPVYVRDGINGLPSVSFSGGQYLATISPGPLIGVSGTSYTVIFVAKFNTADGTIYSEGPNGYWLGSISGGAAICEANRNIVIGASQFPTTNSTVVITAKKLPGNLNYLYVNGNLVSNSQGTISPFTNPIDNPLGYQLTSAQWGSVFSVGAITGGGGGASTPVSTPYFFNGLLGEMFFFDRNLIDSDRIRIEEYLRLKYLPNQ